MAMVIYTVHEPQSPSSDLAERADKVVFVREGFTWAGFFFTVLWLLVHRLWFEAIAAAGFGVVAGAALMALGFGAESSILVNMFVALLIGFEGNDLRRWHLERKGHSMAAAVAGRNLEECERRFFDSWLPHVAQRPVDGWSSWPVELNVRGALPTSRPAAIIGTLQG